MKLVKFIFNSWNPIGHWAPDVVCCVKQIQAPSNGYQADM